MSDTDSAAQAPLQVDPARVDQLESPFRDFRKRWLNKPPLPTRIWLTLRYQFRDFYFVQPPPWRRVLRSRSWEDRPAPEFASTGVVRSGTSAMANYIFQHPSVVLPLAKEPPAAYSIKMIRGNYPTNAQRDAVRRKTGTAMTGYCAPAGSSIMFPYGAKAINPQMKIVVILRNPIDRAFSHWRWDTKLLTRGTVEGTIVAGFPTFDELVDLEIADIERGGIGWTTAAGISGYLRQSMYLAFCSVLYEQFPAEQIKIVNATEFFAEPTRVTQDVYDFLGLPPCEPVVSAEKNAGPSGKLEPATLDRLKAFFEPHNERLYEFLGRDMGW